MDEFGVFVIAMLVMLFLVFWAIGVWYPGSGAEQLDWRPTRSPEVEAELELEDVEQMLEAQNERRRASGRPERSEQQVHDDVEEMERWREKLAREYRDKDPEDTEA